jgi:crotonobetainyl-CoA:carnitine CoA-transferase CaiB-like acyl-CoA transferase
MFGALLRGSRRALVALALAVSPAIAQSGNPAENAISPPGPGKHTPEILAELGYDKAAQEQLRADKVV